MSRSWGQFFGMLGNLIRAWENFCAIRKNVCAFYVLLDHRIRCVYLQWLTGIELFNFFRNLPCHSFWWIEQPLLLHREPTRAAVETQLRPFPFLRLPGRLGMRFLILSRSVEKKEKSGTRRPGTSAYICGAWKRQDEVTKPTWQQWRLNWNANSEIRDEPPKLHTDLFLKIRVIAFFWKSENLGRSDDAKRRKKDGLIHVKSSRCHYV